MTWTATIASAQLQQTHFDVLVTFTDGTVVDKSTFQAADDADLSQQIVQRLAYLNRAGAAKIAGITLGPFVPPIQPAPIPPTQEQIDQNAFLALLQNWKTLKATLASGASKTVTQQSVDDAYAAWKTAYKDAYAPFLVGLF